MYLSRVYIQNYRSIKELDLKFTQGKNVIVGRNNSGKSNILKAIDLILGDSTPTYEKFENITDNDFYNGDQSKRLLIFAELTRSVHEKLNYEEIHTCYGYKIHSKVTEWENKKPKTREAIRHSVNKIPDDLIALFNFDEENINYDSEYINPKLWNQTTFKSQLEDKYHFAYCFLAQKTDKGIKKDIRFLYRENVSSSWVLAFKATIRNELIKSAIIPSFRDPQAQLRISNYSWYGKLLRKTIDSGNTKLQTAFNEVKKASTEVFKNLETKINNSKVQVAFPNTKISIQLNPDKKQDIYKSALIYVDDGFNSQLQDKGAGLQSAVIIGLFDFYTKEVDNSGGSSLLAIEEPELYLHPHGRRVISERLDHFLDEGKNQVILTTHSSEFIATTKNNLNVIVVRKDLNKGTVATNTSFSEVKERQILLKSQNTEMFFADLVILVEGGDKYILEEIAKECGVEKGWGEGWLDEYNISIINCGGKMEFWKYAKKLKEVSIPHCVLSDFDFLREGLSEYLTSLEFKKELKDSVNSLKSKINISGKYKNINQIDKKLAPEVRVLLNELRSSARLFILSDELEGFYLDSAKQLLKGVESKEQGVIKIIYEALANKQPISQYLNTVEFKELLDPVHLHVSKKIS